MLQALAASQLTSWSTEFFLPHLVFPDDPLIRGISLLQVFMVIGLLLFAMAAIPLYYGRFTGKGVVARSFYGTIRNPQYLFLAISGFGLMLYWPRFIILIMYITMLFVYYALLTEEDRRFSDHMLERFPEILEWHQHRFSGGLGRFFRIFYNFVRTWGSLDTDYEVERLIFMRVDDVSGRPVPPAEIFKVGLKRRPVLLVALEASGHALRSVVVTTDNHKWGLMPMPTF